LPTISTAAASSAFAARAATADEQFTAARSAINEAGRFLLERGVLSAGRSFNAAVRLSGTRQAVIAGFRPRASSEPNPAIVIDIDATSFEGSEVPRLREIAAAYAALFRERTDIASILHTHSPNLTAFAVAHRPLPIAYGTSLIKRTADPIPVAAWGPRYAAQPILDVVRAHPNAPALLLANRGVLAFSGESIEKLARFVVGLEESAWIAIQAQVLGGIQPFPRGAHEAMQKSVAAD
jgi:ribulose-5-phosphate 4-epimerase/fuculose-1-phosphate aldolase